MKNCKLYLELGVKITQICYQNTTILSENPLYDNETLRNSMVELLKIVRYILNDLIPQYDFKYIDGYGFSDKDIEDAHEKYQKTLDEISKILSLRDFRIKYIIDLGAYLLTYKLMYYFKGESNLEKERASIETALIGACIPEEYIDCLTDDDIGILSGRVIAYFDREHRINMEIVAFAEKVENYYQCDEVFKNQMLEKLDDIINQMNRKTKIEKLMEMTSFFSNGTTIANALNELIKMASV